MKKLLTILFCFINIICYGTTYYVSNTGDDDSLGTSEAKAWKTLAKVNSITLVAGDSVLLNKGDTWREQLRFDNINGTSANRIVIGAYGTGDNPKIYGSTDGDVESYWSERGSNKWSSANGSFTQTVYAIWYDTNDTIQLCTRVTDSTQLDTNWEFYYDATLDRVIIYHTDSPDTQADGIEIAGLFVEDTRGYIVYLNNCEYFTVRDIEVRYGNYYAMVAYQGAHNDFVNCDLKHNYNKGIYLEYEYYSVVDSCDLDDIGYIGNTSGGESIWVSYCYGVQVRNNDIDSAHNINIDFFQSDSCTAESNYCHDRHPDGYTSCPAVYFDACDDGVAKKNIAENLSRGFAVNAEVAGTSSDSIFFINNIAINCWIGYKTYVNLLPYAGRCTNIFFYHNIAYYDTTGNTNWAAFRIERATDVILKNNIIYDPLSRYKYPFRVYNTVSDFTSDNNCFFLDETYANNYHYGTAENNWLFYATLSSYQTASSQDGNSINSNPLFVAATSNFDINSTSDCVGAGVAIAGITTDYVDSTYLDPPAIGAYEYYADTPPVPPTVTTTSVTYTFPNTVVVASNVTDDGGGTVSERGVVYATHSTPDTTDNKSDSGTGEGAYSITLTDLIKGVRYYFRSYAVNEDTISYGNDLSVRFPVRVRLMSNSKYIKSDGFVLDVIDQNLVLYSEQIDNAAWTKWNITVTAGAVPDVAENATMDTVSQTGAYGVLYQDVTVIPNVHYTFSFDAQRGTSTGAYYRIYDNTNSANIKTATSYYASINASTPTRLSYNFTAPEGCTSVRVYLATSVNGTGTSYIGRAQLAVKGAKYIVTTSTNVE